MPRQSTKPAPDGSRGTADLAIERFRAYLRDHNLKCTPERDLIVAELMAAEGHLEADGLLMRMRHSGRRVSRATIYRTLELLVQAGLARQIRLGTGHYHYERVLGRGSHEHMICLHCGCVLEWFDPALERLLERNLKEHGFTAERHSLQVFGCCRDCSPTTTSTDDLGVVRTEEG